MSDTPRADAALADALKYGRPCTMDAQNMGREMEKLERELNEANADRLRLREALKDAVDNCLWRSEQPFPLSPEESQRIFDVAVTALDTKPPPVVAKDDADALRIDLQAIRMVCEAEGMVVTIGDKSLENYRNKYK